MARVLARFLFCESLLFVKVVLTHSHSYFAAHSAEGLFTEGITKGIIIIIAIASATPTASNSRESGHLRVEHILRLYK